MADWLNVPPPGTKEYDAWMKQEQLRLAKQAAAIAKAAPTASAGVVLGLAKAGVNPNSSTVTNVATVDAQSAVDKNRQAAREVSAKLKESNSKGDGSPVDFLAPLTRTAFMALSTPFEMLEAAVRNVAGGKPAFDNIFGQTGTGQSIKQLLKTGKIDVGTGFLDVDPNSAVGKAMMREKIAAGPKMKGDAVWTYQSGLTQALFDNPETKAARTFEAVSGLVLNLALDPLTYVPGVGLLKVGKQGVTLRTGKAAAGKAAQRVVMKDQEELAAAGLAAATSKEALTAAERKAADLNKLADAWDEAAGEATNQWDLVNKAANSRDIENAKFGDLYWAREQAREAADAAKAKVDELSLSRTGLENKPIRSAEISAAGRTADIIDVLDSMGDQAVIRASKDLAKSSRVAPNLVHTVAEATTDTAVLGYANKAESVVRLIDERPVMEVWDAAPTNADALFNTLADLGPAGEKVADVVASGATNAAIWKAAKAANVTDALTAAYRSTGTSGFSNVQGGFAYFTDAVDAFTTANKDTVSWWAKHGQTPMLAPEAIAGTPAELQARAIMQGTKESVKAEVRASNAAIKAARREEQLAARDVAGAYRDIAAIDRGLDSSKKALDAAEQALQEAVARHEAAIRQAEEIASVRDARRLEMEETFGIAELAERNAAGLLQIDETKVLDYQAFSDYLFGVKGRNIANFIANHFGEGSELELWRAMNRNVSVDTAKELAKATTEKEVLGILAREAGLDFDSATKVGLAARALTFKPGTVATQGNVMRYAMAEKFFNNTAVQGFYGKTASARDYMRRMVPTRNVIHLDDVDRLVTQLDDALPYLRASQELRDKSVRAMMNATTTSERFNVFVDAIEGVVLEQSPKLTEAQREMLNRAKRIFVQREAETRDFAAQVTGRTGEMAEHVVGGQKFSLADGPLIDSQLSNYIKFPDIEQMRQLTGFFGQTLAKNEGIRNMQALVTELFDVRFKQAVLVGRVSYIIRNTMDMQVRSFLAGSATAFNHPLMFISMMVGNPDGNQVQKQLAKLSRFDNTVLGTRFDATNAEEAVAMANAYGTDVDAYALLMARSQGYGLAGVASAKQLPTGMRFVSSTERGFNRAWAGAVWQYRSSGIARLVAGGLDAGFMRNGKFWYRFKEAPAFIDAKKAQGLSLDNPDDYARIITDFMFETDEGIKLRKTISDVDPKMRGALMSEDENVAREATQILFAEIKQGVDNISAGSDDIRAFIAGREMRDTKGKRHTWDSAGTVPKDRWLAKFLGEHRAANLNVEEVVGQLKLPKEYSAGTKGIVAQWDAAAQYFFNVAAMVEKRASLGPEFRQQYWNGVAENMVLMNRSSAEEVLKIAEKELRGLKIFGVPSSTTNPALAQMRSIVKTLDSTGINVEDMHQVANAFASKKLTQMFYDATRQKQWAASMRIVAPFVAAWQNTLRVWGGMIASDVTNTFLLRGNARVYKAANVYDFLNQEETGALYEWVNDSWDSNGQGFIYTDPTYGDKRVLIPLAGDILGAMIGSEPVPVSMSVAGLNLAFSNELLPGVGPAIQLTLGRAMKDQSGWIADQLRNWIYPYGMPEKVSPMQTFTPAWAQRILYGLGMDTFEEKNIATMKPLMAYLGSTGKYGEFPISAENQNKLIDDAAKLNRVLALWRGITANIAPSSISPQLLAKDKDGEAHVQALMYNDFSQIRANNPDNYSLAIAKWVEKYGEQAIFSLVGGSRGGVTPTSEAWTFYQNNRGVADKYPNAFALFFPGGEFSTAFSKWQEQRGQRFNLTPADMQAEAASYVYSARKAQLQILEANAIAQGEDPKAAHQIYLVNKDALDNEFGGEPQTREIGVTREKLLQEATNALKEPEFANTETGKGLKKFLEYRTAAMDYAKQNGYKTLTGKTVAPVAEWLNEKAYEIISEHNEFSVMYWRVFAAETGNR